FNELASLPYFESWILNDINNSDTREIQNRHRVHTFSYFSLAELPYTALATGGLIGNAHFPLLDFFRHNSCHDYYWIVEYDVRYTAPWKTFFELFIADESDFISSHLRSFWQEPRWRWWKSFGNTKIDIPHTDCVRSFNVIYRISGKALRFL